jgi:hypothetical protein
MGAPPDQLSFVVAIPPKISKLSLKYPWELTPAGGIPE